MSTKSQYGADSRSIYGVALIQVLCGAVFAVDIAYESHIEFMNGVSISPVELFHLVVELIAVALLFVGFRVARATYNRIQARNIQNSRLLVSMRGHFDDIIQERFGQWRLSEAECDVALLSIRGLKISEIARIRDRKEGTVKAQLSAIFHKADVGTRAEFMSLFMDDFLDFSSANPPATPPQHETAI